MDACFKFNFPNFNKFYVKAALIYLCLIIYHKVHNVFGTMAGFFSGQLVAGGLELGTK